MCGRKSPGGVAVDAKAVWSCVGRVPVAAIALGAHRGPEKCLVYLERLLAVSWLEWVEATRLADLTGCVDWRLGSF